MVLLERCQHPTKEPVHGQRGQEDLMTLAHMFYIPAPQNRIPICRGKSRRKVSIFRSYLKQSLRFYKCSGESV